MDNMMNKYISICLVIIVFGCGTVWGGSSITGAYGDGIHKDTQAIQAAIDSCYNAGGGTVVFADGKYLTGPLTWKSNVTLQIDSTGSILGSQDKPDYYPVGWDTSNGVPSQMQPLIIANSAVNLTITGKGIIDGQGSVWWPGPDPVRPRLIQINHSQHIRISDVTLKNAPMFHLVPEWCTDIIINHITINAPSTSPNTDGIDPATCHNVQILYCTIDNGDDNIAVKSGSPDPNDPHAASTNIIIHGCTFLHGHGVSIGSETTGRVDSMYVDSCTFNGTDNGLRIKSTRGKGGEIRGLVYKDITMNNVKYPIWFSAYYPSIPSQTDPPQTFNNTTPFYHDISIINLTAINSSANAGVIVGVPEKFLYNIKLQNVMINASKGIRVRNATVFSSDTNLITVNSGSKFIFEVNGSLTDIKTDGNNNLVNNFELYQNYPNPFNPSSVIKYEIPSVSHVKISIYNLLGQLVQEIANNIQSSGIHEISFNATGLSSGVYYYSIQADPVDGKLSYKNTKKMILLK
jgi:polygalacturonase